MIRQQPADTGALYGEFACLLQDERDKNLPFQVSCDLCLCFWRVARYCQLRCAAMKFGCLSQGDKQSFLARLLIKDSKADMLKCWATSTRDSTVLMFVDYCVQTLRPSGTQSGRRKISLFLSRLRRVLASQKLVIRNI